MAVRSWQELSGVGQRVRWLGSGERAVQYLLQIVPVA